MTKAKWALIEAYGKGYRVDRYGKVTSPKGKLLKLANRLYHKAEYAFFSVALCGKSRGVPVHRLQAFQKYGLELFNFGLEVRHRNGISFDNSWGNILLCKHVQNMMDIPKELRLKKAEHASSFAQREDWDFIDRDRKKGMSYRQLQSKYGISKGTLSYRYGSGKRQCKNK